METTEPPEGFAFQYSAFLELSAHRGLSGAGPCPISYSDLGWYCQLNGIQMARWEVNLIMALDNVWLNNHFSKDKHHE